MKRIEHIKFLNKLDTLDDDKYLLGDGKQEKETKEERRKRRKTRWSGSEHDKTFIPGMPTVLPTNLTPEQEKAYLCKFIFCNFFSYHFYLIMYYTHTYMYTYMDRI